QGRVEEVFLGSWECLVLCLTLFSRVHSPPVRGCVTALKQRRSAGREGGGLPTTSWRSAKTSDPCWARQFHCSQTGHSKSVALPHPRERTHTEDHQTGSAAISRTLGIAS